MATIEVPDHLIKQVQRLVDEDERVQLAARFLPGVRVVIPGVVQNAVGPDGVTRVCFTSGVEAWVRVEDLRFADEPAAPTVGRKTFDVGDRVLMRGTVVQSRDDDGDLRVCWDGEVSWEYASASQLEHASEEG